MTRFPTYELAAAGIRIVLDLGIGHIARFEVERDGRKAVPFHRAPWADDEVPPEGTADAPHLARISGDFFCAPFSTSDVEAAPAHGWTANSAWTPVACEAIEGGMRATFRLERTVMGARVFKHLTLHDGHPFLYQSHVFEGGSGSLPVANHAMVALPSGGRISFSAKRWAETPEAPLEADPENGRSALAYPARATDLAAFPRKGGGAADLGTYPIDEGHEDFVQLVEAEGSSLGWSAAVRPGEGDMALMLKNASQLPVTMLWYSNGGRFYAPWSGRHRNVLGIEDGCTWGGNGHAASIAPNPLNGAGIPTAIQLDPASRVEIRHVIGAVPIPAGWEAVKEIRVQDGHLLAVDDDGRELPLPFDTGFLREGR